MDANDRAQDNEDGALAALWPGGANGVMAIEPAPRPDTLDGKRIGFLWDYMFRGEEIFPVLQKAIDSAFDDVRFVGYDEFGSVFGGDEHAVLSRLPGRLKELDVDAVITGIGC
ncbi:MAG TPA: hypothetical protein VM325_18940 [Alphaproteobacteria bacterium]|nr:hypothetical protein [Alphaproteobacteria bacterium]